LISIFKLPYATKFVLVVMPAFLAVAVYGYAVGHGVASALGIGIISAAPFSVGALTGFLFGIPRTVAGAAPPGVVTYQANTNLEQISDWLTKLLVGIGLTQLTRIPDVVQDTGEYLAWCIGPGCGAGVMGAIVVSFAVIGFILSYIGTRLVLTPAIRNAEQPDPKIVDRVGQASLPAVPDDGQPIADSDLNEMLRFSVDDLETPEQFIAWGRAKLERNPRSPEVVRAFERAVDQAPDDRRAAENAAFAALYIPAPSGFKSAIRYAQNYLDRPAYKPTPDDANLFAFLTCAYGQGHRWAVKNHESAETIEAYRRAAIENARKAIDLDPKWRASLRALANPAPGDDENDLDSLRNDEDLKKLLG
jgi:hypothetical protein